MKVLVLFDCHLHRGRQTWSAALYLYAAKCVEEKRTPYFDEVRGIHV